MSGSTSIVNRKIIEFAAVTFATTGNKAVYTPGGPVNIIKWGVVNAGASATTTPPVVALDFRPTAGSDSGRVDGASSGGIDTAGGNMTIPLANLAAGKGAFHALNPDFPSLGTGVSGNSSASALNAGMHVRPGEEAVIEVTTATTAAVAVVCWMEVDELPLVQGNQAGALGGINDLANLAKL